MEVRFLGHASFELIEGDTRVLIDPFLKPNNPAAVVGPDEVEPTHILLTHGHADHTGAIVEIAKRTGATCVAIVELARWLSSEGIESVLDPNLGGTVELEWGWVKLVPALHTNTLPGGPAIGLAAGFVISIGGTTVYHLGDTCLFSDLSLVSDRTPVNVAMVPIGGHYTMDQADAVTAVELLDAEVVIPMHYDTFPAVAADPERFKRDVEASSRTSSKVVILAPGQTYAE